MSRKTKFSKIAKERINYLFELAQKDPEVANSAVRLARKISLKYNVPFSKDKKLFFCKKCGIYLIPGKNSQFRINRGSVVVSCECGGLARFKFK